jgi:glycosyltransferase involved in cell wall biosynthesis
MRDDYSWTDVILIDPRGIVGNGDADTQFRQERYAKALALKPNSPNYYILTTSVSRRSSEDRNYFVLGRPSRFSIPYLLNALRTIRKFDSPFAILTCSDPWESFTAMMILKIMLRHRGITYTQLHADITDPKWRKSTLVNRARFTLAKLSLRISARVRVVTETQKEKLVSSLKIPQSKIFVAPVPLNHAILQADYQSRADLQTIRVGFVGRLHPDRGTSNFLNFVRILRKSEEEFSTVIIGEGIEKQSFLAELIEIVGENRVAYLGFLETESLLQELNKLSVVCSFAPTESYGRILREVIFLGIPVLAAKSAGALEVCQKFGDDAVQIISNFNDEKEVHIKFANAIKSGQDSSLRERIQIEDLQNVDALIESWKRYD